MNYLIWANIYLAVFYGFYWFFLRKETFFQLNRRYLLSSTILSFILPLLDLKDYFFPPESGQFFYAFSLESQVNQVVIPSVNAGNNWIDSFSGLSILTFIYVIGCIFFFIKLLYQGALVKKKLKYSYSGQAYSLFHIIRVDPNLTGYSKIVEHERIHVQQFHSLDILLVELIMIFNWFNPIIYLLHGSIKLNHEYIADEIATNSNNDRIDYAQILLSQALGAPIHSLTNNFFNESFIKKRIAMLFKNKSKRLVLSRFFLLIPILLVVVACQTEDPILSEIQAIGFDDRFPIENSAPFEVFQTDTGVVFTAVEVPPVPTGGMKAFIQSIADNYIYPKEARAAKVKGGLGITFIVEEDGHLSDIKISRDLGYGTGEEAIRVFKNSPNWNPGIQNGKAVRVQYNLLISIGEEIESVSFLPSTSPTTQSSWDIIVDNPTFLEVEQPPIPLDGMPAFLKYIGDHYVYPEEAVNAKVSGRIVLSFVVEQDGNLSDIKSIRDLGFGTGEEAIRVLKAGPKWKPGIQNGMVVRVQYTLPIVLNLNGDSE